MQLLAALVDLLFLGCLAGFIAREIIAARNVRTLKVLVLLALLLVGSAFPRLAGYWHPAALC
ncbi:MAG: hypothetical protein EHM67_08905 [Hyphomicrobiaceae bacterium]|nr:MAG: hypothetical protein EHM67_08905 [Hyphomicrobiaceae bacterium]